ncbi:MAG: hypothetical protein WBM52_08915, partial [Thiogranum sp.]
WAAVCSSADIANPAQHAPLCLSPLAARSIREYCKDIWALAPVDIQLEGNDGPGFLQSLQ